MVFSRTATKIASNIQPNQNLTVKQMRNKKNTANFPFFPVIFAALWNWELQSNIKNIALIEKNIYAINILDKQDVYRYNNRDLHHFQ